jgi:hypothetical protein
MEKTKKKISAKSFFKTLIDLSLDFFSKIMRYVFTWVFPDFLDTLYMIIISTNAGSQSF